MCKRAPFERATWLNVPNFSLTVLETDVRDMYLYVQTDYITLPWQNMFEPESMPIRRYVKIVKPSLAFFFKQSGR